LRSHLVRIYLGDVALQTKKYNGSVVICWELGLKIGTLFSHHGTPVKQYLPTHNLFLNKMLHAIESCIEITVTIKSSTYPAEEEERIGNNETHNASVLDDPKKHRNSAILSALDVRQVAIVRGGCSYVRIYRKKMHDTKPFFSPRLEHINNHLIIVDKAINITKQSRME
jgi:hypothetical protein